MAGTKLTQEEQAFFDTPPEPTPLDEEGVRQPHEEPPEEGGEGEGEKKPAADAKKPDAKDEKDKGKADGKKPEATKQTMVPHGAMEAERRKRKEVETAFEAFRREQAERQARLDERLTIINEALKPKEEKPTRPDKDEDIFGYAEWLEGRLNSLEQSTSERQRQAEERQTQEQQQGQLVTAYSADARAFARETPDFKAAYDHLLASREAELLAIGYAPAQVNTLIRNEEMQIAHHNLASGRSAAEAIYNLARLRGYKPPEAEEPEDPPEEEKKPEAKNGADKIAEIEARREASISLSDGGGGPGGEKISLEAIDRMKPDEFKAFVAKLNRNDPKGYDKLFRRLSLGG